MTQTQDTRAATLRAEFTDSHGEVWSTRVSVATARRIKAEANVDVREIADHDLELLAKLFDDQMFLGMIVYAICKPEAARRGMSEDEFLDRFDGETIERAALAVAVGVADFSRSRRARELLREVVATAETAGERVIEAEAAKLRAATASIQSQSASDSRE